MLNEKEIVSRMELLCPIHFLSLVVQIDLCWIQITKMEIEGVVIYDKYCKGGISREQCIQIIVLTICRGEEVLWEVLESLCEARIDREVEAL